MPLRLPLRLRAAVLPLARAMSAAQRVPLPASPIDPCIWKSDPDRIAALMEEKARDFDPAIGLIRQEEFALRSLADPGLDEIPF